MGQHQVMNLMYHLMMISEALRVIKLLVVVLGSKMILLQNSRPAQQHHLFILDLTMLQMVARRKVTKRMTLLVLCGNVI
jgi:hypothetical protein